MSLLNAQDVALPPVCDATAGVRALVVGDSPEQPRNQLRPGLQSLGLEVFFAPGIERAKRVLRRVPVDVLIVVVAGGQQRSRQSHFDWLRRLRIQRADLPLIVIGAPSNPALEQQADEVDPLVFLTAPVSLRTLRRCIAAGLEARRRAQEMERLELRLAALESAAARGAAASANPSVHQVDELWFAVFNMLLSRGRARARIHTLPASPNPVAATGAEKHTAAGVAARVNPVGGR